MFQRQFTSEVKRCDEMERKVNYIKKEIIKDGGEVREIWNNLPRAPNPREFIDLEAMFEKTENEILELSENFSQLLQNLQELTELQYVLERTHVSIKTSKKIQSCFHFISFKLSRRISSTINLPTWNVLKVMILSLLKIKILALSLVLFHVKELLALSEFYGVFHEEIFTFVKRILKSLSKTQKL